MLKEVMGGFESAYLVLDGLDECPKSDQHRAKLLNALRDILLWHLPHLHLIASSRKETEIQDVFDDLAADFDSLMTVSV